MTLNSPAMTPDMVSALEVARSMAAAGVPIFVAQSSDNKVGFQLPPAWQRTEPDPAVVDTWRPGDALCAVMGRGIDLVDADPRNGAAWREGMPVPQSYGTATTPSGGVHSFIRSMGAGSHDAVLPGIDVKGGMADGSSRGFAFIAPTVKPSKVTGEPGHYRWVKPVDVMRARAATGDASGMALAQAVARARGSKATAAPATGGPEWYREFASGTEAHSAAVADRTIERELRAVSQYNGGLGGGFRGVLMRAAMILGGYVGAGHLEPETAEMKLSLACSAVWGGADTDDALWIEQGLRDGAAKPFRVFTAADQVAAPGVSQAARWTFYNAIGVHLFDPNQGGSDQELAEQVLARLRPGMRAASDAGTWLMRSADVWEETDSLAEWAVTTVARLMPLGETPIPKDHADRTPAHWQAHRRGLFMSSAGTSRVAQKIKAIAKGQHPATVRLTELDADPEVLWAGGTPWDLRLSAELPKQADTDPEVPHLHTARFTPDARETPLWDAFVRAVWPDEAMRAWALRVLSVAVTGHSPRVMPVLYGETGRGKSQIVDLLAHALGTYGGEGDARLITNPDAHASIVYALKGKRLVYVDEPPPAHHDKIERVKALTGGTQLTGNAMRQNPVSFTPTHTLVMMTNPEGMPPLTDDALRDRSKVLYCTGDPAEVERTRKALGWVSSSSWSDQWAAEAPGVLAAFMREAAAWLADTESTRNDRAPISAQTAVAEMVAGSDPVQRWMEECTAPAEPGTKSTELHRRFGQWFSEHPEYRRRAVPSAITFGIRLTKLGVGTTAGRDGNHRHLAIREYGTPWAVPPVVGGVEGQPSTEPQPSTQPSTGDKPRSAPVLPDAVKGVDSSSLYPPLKLNTPIYTPIESERVNRGEPSNPPQNPVDTGSDQRVSSVVGSSNEPPTGPHSAPSAPDTRDVASTGLSRTELTKLKRAEVKAAKLAEAAGTHLGLPAAMRRGEAPRAVTLDEAWAITTAALARSGRLAVDVETSGFPIGHPDYALRTIQLGDVHEGIDLDATDPDSLELARRIMAEAPELNAHSATADLAPLALADALDYAEAFGRMVDTAILAKLADPAGTDNESGLKELAPAVLGTHAVTPAAEAGRKALFAAGGWLTDTKPTTPAARSGWAQVDPGCATMIAYAVSDVLDCAALRIALPMPSAEVLDRERRVQTITARPAHTGLPLDAGRVETQLAEREPRVAELSAGITALTQTDAGPVIFNPESSKQVIAAFTARDVELPHGKPNKQGKTSPSADKEALTPLRNMPGLIGELAGLMLDYRADSTLLKNMLRPWSVQTRQGDGRTYPTIYTLGADTGRMSCVRPNLQQVSREGGLRECVVADPGYTLIAADFSSVEVRVAAAVSGDEALKRMVIEGVDLHSVIAEQVWGPGFTKADRYVAKRGVFGRLYGGGIGTLAKQVGVSETVMSSVVDVMDSVAAGVAAWSTQVREAVKAGHTQYPAYSGRVIHLDPALPHKAPNYIIQGTARELLVDALIEWDDGPYGGGLVLPVHDEIVAMVPAEVADAATEYLVQCMTTEIMGVPITVEADAPSERWTSAG